MARYDKYPESKKVVLQSYTINDSAAAEPVTVRVLHTQHCATCYQPTLLVYYDGRKPECIYCGQGKKFLPSFAVGDSWESLRSYCRARTFARRTVGAICTASYRHSVDSGQSWTTGGRLQRRQQHLTC